MGGGGNTFLGIGNSMCEGVNPLNVLRDVSSVVWCGEGVQGEGGGGGSEAGQGAGARPSRALQTVSHFADDHLLPSPRCVLRTACSH